MFLRVLRTAAYRTDHVADDVSRKFQQETQHGTQQHEHIAIGGIHAFLIFDREGSRFTNIYADYVQRGRARFPTRRERRGEKSRALRHARRRNRVYHHFKSRFSLPRVTGDDRCSLLCACKNRSDKFTRWSLTTGRGIARPEKIMRRNNGQRDRGEKERVGNISRRLVVLLIER